MATEVYPVVHINDIPQAIEQAGVALEADANGVYLIDHHEQTPNNLFATLNLATQEYPDSHIGINILCMQGAFTALQCMKQAVRTEGLDSYPGGLWVDDARIQTAAAHELRSSDFDLANIRYLGGVAFKYSPSHTEDPVLAAKEAAQLAAYMDVVTTSGPGTGQAPSVGKIEAMREVIGSHPLAVASGVSIDNLEDYGGHIDQLLIASSIESSPGSGIFDHQKLSDLVQMAHEL